MTQVIESRDPRWSEVLAGIQHDVYHVANYVDHAAARERAHGIGLYTQEDGAQAFLVVVEAPIPEGGGRIDALSPYGYPAPLFAIPATWSAERRHGFLARTLRQWTDVLRQRGVVSCFVRLHPLIPVDHAALSVFGRILHHGQTVSVDLRQQPAQIWRGMRANHRTGINKAERQGHEVLVDHNWDHLDTFVAAYAQTMSRVGAQSSYFFERGYFSGLRRALGGGIHLLLSRIKGRVAAGALFTECNGIVQYHLGGTFDEFLHQHPHKQLYYRAMLWARDRGNQVFHLGGGLGGKEDSLFHFKAGFSPSRHDFHTWRLVIDPVTYQQLVTTWESRSGQASRNDGYFPPYRQPPGDLSGAHLQQDATN